MLQLYNEENKLSNSDKTLYEELLLNTLTWKNR